MKTFYTGCKKNNASAKYRYIVTTYCPTYHPHKVRIIDVLKFTIKYLVHDSTLEFHNLRNTYIFSFHIRHRFILRSL